MRRVFVASGIRYDLILADKARGRQYLEQILAHHVSGQLKIAPEHSETKVLKHMGKPGKTVLEAFMDLYEDLRKKTGAKTHLTYYLMAAHPGCTQKDMQALRAFCLKRLGILPEQVQIFTPTPATLSTLMYAVEKEVFTGEDLFVEKNLRGKQKQKDALGKNAPGKKAGPKKPGDDPGDAKKGRIRQGGAKTRGWAGGRRWDGKKPKK